MVARRPITKFAQMSSMNPGRGYIEIRAMEGPLCLLFRRGVCWSLPCCLWYLTPMSNCLQMLPAQRTRPIVALFRRGAPLGKRLSAGRFFAICRWKVSSGLVRFSSSSKCSCYGAFAFWLISMVSPPLSSAGVGAGCQWLLRGQRVTSKHERRLLNSRLLGPQWATGHRRL